MKISLVEYGSGIILDNLFAGNVTIQNLKVLLDRANIVIQRSLKTNKRVLEISDGKLRALGIAGAIRLSKEIEIEIVPKMLNDSQNGDWKESLFLLAALSKYGNIITTEHIHSSTAYKESLYDIAGRILAREYLNNKRKPIRQYRRERFADFAIDGEIDFERAFEKNPDGIPQSRVSFDKINPLNATIRSAMQIVLPYVKDVSIKQIILRAIQELGEQPLESTNKLRVPARNKEWTEIYNLSFDIVSGMGSSLESGEIMSPSFIVDTWRIWEWLITIALKIGLGNSYKTIPQAKTAWGVKKIDEKSFKVNVFPDIAVVKRSLSNIPLFLVDAKYKVLPEGGTVEIERSDLYEAFAFCRATGAKKIFLAYPTATSCDRESGSVSCLSVYEIEDITIAVINVAFGTITKQGDITFFCRKMASDIMAII